MTSKPQFYLIASSNIPADLWILTGDRNQVDKDFDGLVTEDFCQTLTPIGENIPTATFVLPSDTKFAGVLWGDGEHFDMSWEPTWGKHITRHQVADLLANRTVTPEQVRAAWLQA